MTTATTPVTPVTPDTDTEPNDFDIAVAMLSRLTKEQLGVIRLRVIPDLQREKRGVVVTRKPEPNSAE